MLKKIFRLQALNHTYLHKKHENIIPAITRSLKAMEKEGRIQEIREQVIRGLLK